MLQDEQYMQRAIELAKKGEGKVNPNPLVGAVIVKNGKIIGEGYHEEYGKLHAERNAILSCKEKEQLNGATIYVTLEPCCHYGKTPPCTDAIIEHKLARVVIGAKDINPLVQGKGIQKLKAHGIEVTEGVLEKECQKLNEVFFHYMRTKKPFVVMKYAMTMDGKICTKTGASKWITGEKAREQVHNDRNKYKGIMVGVQTVITDDPMLNCRIEGGRNPVRIICDTHLRTPLNSKIVETAGQIPTIIATAQMDEKKKEEFYKKGVQIITLSLEDGRVSLQELMKELGQREIDGILLEGGGTLNWSALESHIVNKVQTYIAPKIFGGESAKSPVRGIGIAYPDAAVRLKNMEIKKIGADFLIESEVE